MNCKTTNKLFTAYLDNELQERERERIEEHLASCAACREELEALKATQGKFRQTLKMVTDAKAPSDETWAALRQQIILEKEAATSRVLPSGKSWWGRVGRIEFLPRRFTWKTALGGGLALVVIASLAIGLPILTERDQTVSAAEIALQNPEVQAALGGTKPEQIGVTDNFDSTGTTRVVMTTAPDRAVIADVDMKNKVVKSVEVQVYSEVTQQQALDIAEADSRVKALLDSGYNLYFYDIGEFTPTTLASLTPEETQMIEGWGIRTKDLIGVLATMALKKNEGDYGGTLVWVNVSTEKIVAFVKDPFGSSSQTVTTVYVTSIPITGPIPTPVFATPDPGSVNGSPTGNYSMLFIEHTTYHLVVAETDLSRNTRYATWTWNVTDADVQKILDIARSDSQVQNLLSQGARFASVSPSFMSVGTSNLSGSQHGLMWSANVRIDLGEISYTVTVNLTSPGTTPIGAGFARPKSFSPLDIVLP